MVIYAPSPHNEIIRASQQELKYFDHDLNWWGQNPFFRHSSLLINFFHQGQMDFRQSMKVGPEVTVIGDSGGFEILSRRARGKPVTINALDCLKWQEANCDIGMTLDLSPVNLQPVEGGKSVASSPEPISHEEFEKRLEETCNNNQIFQDNRQNPKMKIYNIVHSGMGKVESIDIWYNRVKDFKFEGWSVAPKPPGDPMKVAMDCMFMYSRGIRTNLHVLGISGIKVLPVLVRLEQLIKPISTDSFSFAVNAIVRKFMIPYGPELYFRPAEKKYKKLPCGCPVCINVRDVEDYYRTDVVGYGIIGLHNLWCYLNYLQYLETLIDDKELWDKFVNQHNNLVLAMRFIDEAVDKGWEEAVSRLGYMQKSLGEW